ncbi:hypothetical protein [Sphaerisporangium album]|uniref:hypothetical protein n=1 Tax=Sphaerisporangium album TaxID=509200 RepID=UPI0011C02283|nr:hypothetical protein [Sphaerisporangium album]
MNASTGRRTGAACLADLGGAVVLQPAEDLVAVVGQPGQERRIQLNADPSMDGPNSGSTSSNASLSVASGGWWASRVSVRWQQPGRAVGEGGVRDQRWVTGLGGLLVSLSFGSGVVPRPQAR